jgi:hypothetical protein
MAQSFSAIVSDWCRAEPERIEAVAKAAVQEVISIAQTPVSAGGNLPVDTGFMRASLTAEPGLTVPAATRASGGDAPHSFDATSVNLTIANADLETGLTFAWTANYSRHVHYGTSKMQGRPFLTLAAQRWPQILAEQDRLLQARNAGR